MNEQNFKNHTKFDPLYHFISTPLALLTFIGSIVYLILSITQNDHIFTAVLVFILALLMIFCIVCIRVFPLKAQDRAIRAEENLRHYVLTGKLLDPSLSVKQVVALRFASDDEFVILANRAAKENLSPTDIKKSIRNWKPDFYRA